MATRTKTDKIVIPVIVALSLVVPLVVLLLMNLNVRYNLLGLEVGTFPFFHAVINACTALLLLAGYFLIKIGDMKWHRNVMITAFALSCVFLVSYVISKISNDPVPYGGEGILRPIYFFILISHIVLSVAIIPLVLISFVRGISQQFTQHRKIARITFPIWLYVTITGVIVYYMISPYYV